MGEATPAEAGEGEAGTEEIDLGRSRLGAGDTQVTRTRHARTPGEGERGTAKTTNDVDNSTKTTPNRKSADDQDGDGRSGKDSAEHHHVSRLHRMSGCRLIGPWRREPRSAGSTPPPHPRPTSCQEPEVPDSRKSPSARVGREPRPGTVRYLAARAGPAIIGFCRRLRVDGGGRPLLAGWERVPGDPLGRGTSYATARGARRLYQVTAAPPAVGDGLSRYRPRVACRPRRASADGRSHLRHAPGSRARTTPTSNGVSAPASPAPAFPPSSTRVPPASTPAGPRRRSGGGRRTAFIVVGILSWRSPPAAARTRSSRGRTGTLRRSRRATPPSPCPPAPRAHRPVVPVADGQCERLAKHQPLGHRHAKSDPDRNGAGSAGCRE